MIQIAGKPTWIGLSLPVEVQVKAGTRLWWQANDDVPACSHDAEDVYQMHVP